MIAFGASATMHGCRSSGHLGMPVCLGLSVIVHGLMLLLIATGWTRWREQVTAESAPSIEVESIQAEGSGGAGKGAGESASGKVRGVPSRRGLGSRRVGAQAL